MALYHFHRLLIVASIIGDVGFSWWCVTKYNRTLEADRAAWTLMEHPLSWGVMSTIAVILLAVYLVHFSRNVRRIQQMLTPPYRCSSCHYDLTGHRGNPSVTCPECGTSVEPPVPG